MVGRFGKFPDWFFNNLITFLLETLMSTFKNTFNFRTVTVAKLAAMLAALDDVKIDMADSATMDKLFTVEEKDSNDAPTKYKRKPVTLELDEPSFVTTLPDDLSKNLVRDYVAAFVKSQYVDNFLEVGPHDWETICKVAAESRGSSAISISETALELSAASFGNWVAADTGHEELGKRITGIVEGKVTQASITKQLGQCNPEVLEKLIKRADAWAEYIGSSGDDHTEELSEGYEFITTKLDKLLKKLTGSDVVDLVASVL